jgi:hypothetical protein
VTSGPPKPTKEQYTMKQLRLLGLMLLAVFALGSTVVASASASERGVLTLKAVALVGADAGKAEAVPNVGTLTAGGKAISCKKLWVLALSFGPSEPKKEHFNLTDKDADFHFSECATVEGGIKCNSETDSAGTILVLSLVHLINMLDKAGGKLVAGAAATVLDTSLLASLLILCGILHITVRGTAFILIDPLNKNKEITLTEKVEHFTVTALKEHFCDTGEGEKVCGEFTEKAPLEANFGGGFSAATEVTEPYLMTVLLDGVLGAVLWDD